jgi:hypothetical protein
MDRDATRRHEPGFVSPPILERCARDENALRQRHSEIRDEHSHDLDRKNPIVVDQAFDTLSALHNARQRISGEEVIQPFRTGSNRKRNRSNVI